MTENADVKWLRGAYRDAAWQFPIDANRARRLIAHIDQLEEENARLHEWVRNRPEPDAIEDLPYSPTVHEIAAQMMAAIQIDQKSIFENVQDLASLAYDAAEALVAEGRRRDGLS